MPVFLISVAAAVVIAIAGALVLNSLQRPAELVFKTDSVRAPELDRPGSPNRNG